MTGDDAGEEVLAPYFDQHDDEPACLEDSGAGTVRCCGGIFQRFARCPWGKWDNPFTSKVSPMLPSTKRICISICELPGSNGAGIRCARSPDPQCEHRGMPGGPSAIIPLKRS